MASLAEARLTENTKKGIRSLNGDASLASVANWADEVRPERDETYNWHFVDIPANASGFPDERDCFLPNSRHKGSTTDHHNCVVDRIVEPPVVTDQACQCVDKELPLFDIAPIDRKPCGSFALGRPSNTALPISFAGSVELHAHSLCIAEPSTPRKFVRNPNCCETGNSDVIR